MAPYEGFHDRLNQRRSSTAARSRDNSRDRASSRPMDRNRDRPGVDRSAVQSQGTNKDRYWDHSAHRSGDRRSGARFHEDFRDRNSWSGRASERDDGSRYRQTRGAENSGSSREHFQERNHGGEQRGGHRLACDDRWRSLESSEGRHDSVLAGGSANSRGCGHGRSRAGNGRKSGIIGNDHSSVGANGTRRSNTPQKQELPEASAGFARGEGDCDFPGGFSISSHGDSGGSQGTIVKASGIVGNIASAATSSNMPESRHESEEEELPNHMLGKKPDFKTSGSEIAKGLKFVSDREEDPHRLGQRQKQIDFGKNTVGYDEYMRKVPIHKRRRGDPVTPNKYEKMSKRRWAGRIRSWRRQLHVYDKNAPLYETPCVDLDLDEPKEPDDVVASLSSLSSRESKGVAKGDIQQQKGNGDLNAGIYDEESVLDEFGLNDMAEDGVIKRKRRESSAICRLFDMQDSSFEENDEGVEGDDQHQHRVVKRRCGPWNGWGMSTVKGNRLKIAQGELLEGDELSTREGDVLQGRVASAGLSGTVSDEVTMEEEDASQSDREASVSKGGSTGKGVECGQAVAGGGDDGAKVDWEDVDFSDDELL